MVLVVVLSLASAFAFAFGSVVQQRATRNADAAHAQAPDAADHVVSRLPVVGLIRTLGHSKLWFFGWCVNTSGFFIQAAALHFGSIALVQPLGVTQLLFTIGLVAAWTRTIPLRRDWFFAVLICAGVALFLTVRGPISQDDPGDRAKILLACIASAGLIVVLVLVASTRPPLRHAADISVAAGLCFALSAVLTKLTTADLVHRGIVATAMDWPGYGLAAATLLGLLLEQEAFRSGSLPVSIATMTIANPIFSYLIAVLAFNVALPTSPGALAAIAGSAALLIAGTAGLAGSPAVQGEAYESELKSGDSQSNMRA